MSREYSFGRVAGLKLLAIRPMLIGTILLWLAFSGLALWLLELSVMQAIAAGFVATLLYWLSDVIHQLGHAYAARQTGYPMTGIRLGTFLIFSTSLYPEDEPPLPAPIHIRRALGGPVGSLLFGILAGIVALLTGPLAGLLWWLALFLFVVNAIWFAIGALIPMGFTDGSTLLHWWRRPGIQ